MLWEVEIRPNADQFDREAERVLNECRLLGIGSVSDVRSGRSFLIETDAERETIQYIAGDLLADRLVETYSVRELSRQDDKHDDDGKHSDRGSLLNVLFKPGVTDNVGASTRNILRDMGLRVEAVATCRKYWIAGNVSSEDRDRLIGKVLANEAIDRVLEGPLKLDSLAVGESYEFELLTVPLRDMSDEQLDELSRSGQLFLSRPEMQTIRQHFRELGRDPSDVELETIAQTWSEHCSHKTLAGRIRYRDEQGERPFENMLKETIFAATAEIRRQLGTEDWCVSVFEDNAGIVTFDERQHVCFKVETHNHPSALEPYGGANTGIGGVIRDPLGTGLGARPVCNTDVFCFAPPETPAEELPPGVLPPRTVMQGVVAGVRDYGNRMGIPTVNGAVYFDRRYLGNPLVYCGNVAMIPVEKARGHLQPGHLIVAVGGRTGRDGIHGATFSSGELTHLSETLSGGAVQIGNPLTEKMMTDVILQARDRDLYSAITDCGAGGFSSAVGEMGEDIGAEVWLDRCPLKYAGLSYTEIWISEAQERMVLAVPPENWDELHSLFAAEGVEATVIGEFRETGRLVLTYEGHPVADLSMQFLHKGRPPVVRDAVWPGERRAESGERRAESGERRAESEEFSTFDAILKRILGSLNVASKEWIIRGYDHEVQGGSVVKPLTGIQNDGPSDAAVVRPDLTSHRGLVLACGMNPHYGDMDPYWMAASAIDEAVRNCLAVGADPRRIALLDNFCWGNTERPEVLGSLVRAALGCHDVAVAYRTPFISGKDSLNNEFSYVESDGTKHNVTVPPSLLISALGQIEDVTQAVTMDLKEPGNTVYLLGQTYDELGGSHYELVEGISGGRVPRVDLETAPQIFAAVHRGIQSGLLRSCHDLSEGGLAVATSEMAFAGGCGMQLDLRRIAEAAEIDDPTVLLFSESNTRFLVEVPEDCRPQWEVLCEHLPLIPLGRVTETDRLQIDAAGGRAVIDSSLAELKAAWKEPLEPGRLESRGSVASGGKRSS